MMSLAWEQAKHDPELMALLKELDESENQIAELTDVLGSVQGLRRENKGGVYYE